MLLLFLSGQPVPTEAHAGGSANAKPYSHDVRGLEKQFGPLMKAYYNGNAAAIDKEYAPFVLPNAISWFLEYFPADQTEQLGWDYESESGGLKNSLPGMMKILGGGQRFHAKCSVPEANRKTGLQPDPDARQPVKEVPVEQFEIKFVAENGRYFSILANFVYVEGAYRYLGKGAYPFWSMPDATRKK